MPRLPILMYHNLTTDCNASNGLTLSLQNFENQLAYLKKQGYSSCFFSELEELDYLPKKTVIITFDDVTINQLQAVELLKKYHFKATFFIPFAYVGKMDEWNNQASEKIMSVMDLKNIDSDVVELGHHSFLHRKYASLTEEELKADFESSFDFIKKNQLQVYPVLAFPYGNFPKKKPSMQSFFNLLKGYGFKYALRIGNRTNTYPFKKSLLLKRIDIKGEDSLFTFKIKLKIGKLSLF